jgi:hypothetical protein
MKASRQPEKGRFGSASPNGASSPPDCSDIVVAIDASEHFGDSGGILRTMERLLKADGQVVATFAPTWYNPLGGHLFSFSKGHLLFSEQALIRWRIRFSMGPRASARSPGGEPNGGSAVSSGSWTRARSRRRPSNSYQSETPSTSQPLHTRIHNENRALPSGATT